MHADWVQYANLSSISTSGYAFGNVWGSDKSKKNIGDVHVHEELLNPRAQVSKQLRLALIVLSDVLRRFWWKGVVCVRSEVEAARDRRAVLARDMGVKNLCGTYVDGIVSSIVDNNLLPRTDAGGVNGWRAKLEFAKRGSAQIGRDYVTFELTHQVIIKVRRTVAAELLRHWRSLLDKLYVRKRRAPPMQRRLMRLSAEQLEVLRRAVAVDLVLATKVRDGIVSTRLARRRWEEMCQVVGAEAVYAESEESWQAVRRWAVALASDRVRQVSKWAAWTDDIVADSMWRRAMLCRVQARQLCGWGWGSEAQAIKRVLFAELRGGVAMPEAAVIGCPPLSTPNLHLASYNAGGLTGQGHCTPELLAQMMLDGNIHILGLNETKLIEDHGLRSAIAGMRFFGCGLKVSKVGHNPGGGVGFLVRSADWFEVCVVEGPVLPNRERTGLKWLRREAQWMWLKVMLKSATRDLYLCSVYWSTAVKPDVELLLHQIAHFSRLGAVILLGDFNANVLHASSLERLRVGHGAQLSTLLSRSRVALSLLNDRTVATHCNGHSAETLLDLVMVSATDAPMCSSVAVSSCHAALSGPTMGHRLVAVRYCLQQPVVPKPVKPTRLFYRLKQFKIGTAEEKRQREEIFQSTMLEELEVSMKPNTVELLEAEAERFAKAIDAALRQSVGAAEVKDRAIRQPWWSPALTQRKQSVTRAVRRMATVNERLLVCCSRHEARWLRGKLEEAKAVWKAQKKELMKEMTIAKRQFWERTAAEENDDILQGNGERGVRQGQVTDRLWSVADVLKERKGKGQRDLGSRGVIAADSKETQQFWSDLARERALPKEEALQEEIRRALEGHMRWQWPGAKRSGEGAGDEVRRGDAAAERCRPFTVREVSMAVRRLPSGKSSGPDAVPNEALRRLPEQAMVKMTELFNAALSLEALPEAWRKGSVVLLLKKEADPLLPGSYRPITLLSNVRKLLELLLLQRIEEWPKFRTIFGESQAGFRRGRSTTKQALTLLTLQQIAQRRGVSLYAVLLDLCKAFDSAAHTAILAKALRLGFAPTEVAIFRLFLTGIESELPLASDQRWFKVGRGTPQGSRLSPLFYLIFINDLMSSVELRELGFDASEDGLGKIGVLGYADDTTPVASSLANIKAQLEWIDRWAAEWGASFNASKSMAIALFEPAAPRASKGRKAAAPEARPTLLIGAKLIPWVAEAPFLGVRFVSVQAKRSGRQPETQVLMSKAASARVEAAGKTLDALGPLLRPVDGLCSAMGLRVYRAIVESAMLYGAELYDLPDSAEKIQRRACRMVLGAYDREHTAQTHAELGMARLETIVLRCRIYFAYKLLDTAEMLPWATLRVQLDARGGPLPWAASLLRSLDSLGVRDRWDTLRAALADAATPFCVLKAVRKRFCDGVEKALYERERVEAWSTIDGAMPKAIGVALPHLALAYRHAHIGYLFRRESFNPPDVCEPAELPCPLCHTAAADTPWHFAVECSGGGDLNAHNALRHYRDHIRQLYAEASDRCSKPLPPFHPGILALRRVPDALRHDTQFYQSVLSSMASIYHFRAEASRRNRR